MTEQIAKKLVAKAVANCVMNHFNDTKGLQELADAYSAMIQAQYEVERMSLKLADKAINDMTSWKAIKI